MAQSEHRFSILTETPGKAIAVIEVPGDILTAKLFSGVAASEVSL